MRLDRSGCSARANAFNDGTLTSINSARARLRTLLHVAQPVRDVDILEREDLVESKHRVVADEVLL